jgi:hypothetical protein
MIGWLAYRLADKSLRGFPRAHRRGARRPTAMPAPARKAMTIDFGAIGGFITA